MNILTKSIVISALKFKDNNLIVKCYTQEFGVQNYILKGILSTSAKRKLKPAYFQPLMQLEIIATQRNKGSLEYIKEAKVSYHYQELYCDMTKNSVAFFLSEIAHIILNEAYKDEPMFELWTQYLQWYDLAPVCPNFHLKFLLEISYHLGFYPDISTLENSFFDLEDGKFVNEHNGHLLIDTKNTDILKKIIASDLDNLNTILLNRDQRNDILEYLLKYYTIHLPNFKIPKSLDVLRSIFN